MKILFYDNGLNTELAVSMARCGHTVAYTTPWTEAFPKPAKAWIGRGLEGIEVVDSFTKALPKADFVICPDTFSQDRVEQARKMLGSAKVFGAGQAEKMELDRPFMKDLQKAIGLPVGEYKVLSGFDNLIKHLQTTKDRWIKTSKYRQYETFKHEDWETTRNTHLGALLDAYGPAGDTMSFISEAPLKGVEIGFDRLFCMGDWVGPAGWGYEAKDEAYIGTHGVLPPVLKSFCDALQRPLKSFQCASFVSNEVIVADKAYMIEPTIRCPHPPLAGMLCMYEKLCECVLGDASLLKPAYDYCAVLVMRSSWAGDHWLEIKIKDDAWRPKIKLSQACRINGKYYAVPGNEFIGYCVGVGTTPHIAAMNAKKTAEKVSCKELDINPSALDKLIEQTIPEGRKVGIPF